jgi:hypothetical protein
VGVERAHSSVLVVIMTVIVFVVAVVIATVPAITLTTVLVAVARVVVMVSIAGVAVIASVARAMIMASIASARVVSIRTALVVPTLRAVARVFIAVAHDMLVVIDTLRWRRPADRWGGTRGLNGHPAPVKHVRFLSEIRPPGVITVVPAAIDQKHDVTLVGLTGIRVDVGGHPVGFDVPRLQRGVAAGHDAGRNGDGTRTNQQVSNPGPVNHPVRYSKARTGARCVPRQGPAW